VPPTVGFFYRPPATTANSGTRPSSTSAAFISRPGTLEFPDGGRLSISATADNGDEAVTLFSHQLMSLNGEQNGMYRGTDPDAAVHSASVAFSIYHQLTKQRSGAEPDSFVYLPVLDEQSTAVQVNASSLEPTAPSFVPKADQTHFANLLVGLRPGGGPR
jgi:hypothetical protein